jgi:hypothetical protein
MSSSSVTFFPVDHPVIARTVRARLEKYRIELIEQVAGASVDWPDFQYRKGRLQGVDDAIQHCLDVEAAINKERNA